MTCVRAEAFLDRTGVAVRDVVNAKSRRLSKRDALALLDDADELYSMKGRRITHVDLRRSRPPRADLLALVLGPTGNLRAPTLRRGRTLIVGFDEPTFRSIFG